MFPPDPLHANTKSGLADIEEQEHPRWFGPRVRAVAVVLPAERALGWAPEMMAHNNPGFDITSVDPRTGEITFIEVKGRIAGATSFFVTNNEIQHGQNAGRQYRLALVEVSPQGPEHDVVRYVDGPFRDVAVTALVKGVQFNWAKAWAEGQAPW